MPVTAVNNLSSASNKFHEATTEEINEKTNNAYTAFLAYRNFPGNIKACFLEGIAFGIETERKALLETAMQETHLAEARLPAGKTLQNFEFDKVPMVSKAQVMALTSGDSWLDKGANLGLVADFAAV